MRHALVQKMTADGAELDLGLFRKLTYVETLDLSGPRLLLEVDDVDRVLRDDLGVKEGAVIDAQIDDSEAGGSLNVSERFVIKSVDSDAYHRLSIQCLAEPVDILKRPSEGPLFLTLKTPQEVLAAATGLALDVGDLPLVDAWHLLPGERTSKKLRTMARELGAAIWYSRGKLHMHPLRELWSRAKVKTFHHDDTRKPHMDQITDWKLTHRKEVINDRVKRNYSGWSMTEGVLGGGGKHEATQHHQAATLENLNLAVVPAMDLLTPGQGELKPGDRVELKFHRSMQGRPFDESIPPLVMIHAIASQQEKDAYRTRIKGVILNE